MSVIRIFACVMTELTVDVLSLYGIIELASLHRLA